MRHWWMVLGVAVFTACGPPIERGPDDDEDIDPPECAPGECDPPPKNESLWPMSAGSSWTYKITDPTRIESFEKRVRVQGKERVPGTDLEGVLFISEQPHLTERSWQIEENGLAKRVREEDQNHVTGARRSTTWAPRTIKALTTKREKGWEDRVAVVETIIEDGVSDQKEKEFVWRVLEVDVEVTVMGQTMKAFKVERYRADKEGEERYYWFVPGIGKVREEGERTKVLTHYEIK